MTEEEMDELKEEFSDAWWNLDYDSYKLTVSDIVKAIDNKDTSFFEFVDNYVEPNLPDWMDGREEEMIKACEVYTDSLIVYCLISKNYKMADYLSDCDHCVTDAQVMEQLFDKEYSEQMQWLLDNLLVKADSELWRAWSKIN